LYAPWRNFMPGGGDAWVRSMVVRLCIEMHEKVWGLHGG